MSENTKSGGGLSGIIGFVVIVAIWTGINHWRQSSSIMSQCEDQQLGEEFCGCFKSEMMSELGIQSSIPFIGRFTKSDDAWDKAQNTANMTCIAQSAAE